MIRFDNGPPGGDYVRYIDELMAQRATALKSDGSTTHSPSAHASQRTSALSSTAAPAVASTMMTRDNPRRVVPIVGTSIVTIAIAAGVVLVLIGILGETSNVLFIVAGIALVSWALKRLGASVETAAATTTAATATDVFTAMPARRTPAVHVPRIKARL